MRPPPTSAQSLRVAPYLWMLGGALSFSLMSFLASSLRHDLPWQWIAVGRTGFALLFALPIAMLGGAKLVFLRPRTLWVRSIAGSVSVIGLFYAMTHYPVSEVLTLSNMFPLWVAVLSWPVLGEIPSLDVWLAMAIGMCGVVLMQQPQFGQAEVAVPLAVLSSLTSAIALLGLHRLKQLDPRSVVVHFSAVSLLFCLAALIFLPAQPAAPLTAKTVGLVVAMGLCATVGQLLLTKAFAAGPPAQVAVVGLSQVGFAMLLELGVSHRQFGGITLLGISLVVTPTLWMLLRGAWRDVRART